MKIVSKYKDYYDYLSGIYGIDENIVLDRTFDYKYKLNYDYISGIFTLYIAGYIIEGLCINGVYYYGDELKQFEITEKTKHRYYFSKHTKRDYEKSIYINTGTYDGWIYLEPIEDKEEINKKQNCAIIYNNISSYNYPILREFNLSKFIEAKTIYQWIYDYLSKIISDKEKSSDMSNDNKIISKGFDLKTSFRNIK